MKVLLDYSEHLDSSVEVLAGILDEEPDIEINISIVK